MEAQALTDGGSRGKEGAAMAELHWHVGWWAILVGLLGGAALGLRFHRDQWLGGYSSWRRRLLRLTHISLVGTGLLNLAAAATADSLGRASLPRLASVCFILGAITMPSVCALAAWRPLFRHAFFVPVLSLIVAVADLIWEGLWR
jgi:hypothetical protein